MKISKQTEVSYLVYDYMGEALRTKDFKTALYEYKNLKGLYNQAELVKEEKETFTTLTTVYKT